MAKKLVYMDNGAMRLIDTEEKVSMKIDELFSKLRHTNEIMLLAGHKELWVMIWNRKLHFRVCAKDYNSFIREISSKWRGSVAIRLLSARFVINEYYNFEEIYPQDRDTDDVFKFSFYWGGNI